MSLTPFTIPAMHEEINDLRSRIANTRWSQSLKFDDRNRGMDIARVNQLATFWSDRFDWSVQVEQMNSLPHFMATIDDQSLHVVHVKSSREDAIPLLLLHGFPGSFLEFMHVIEPLTEPDSGQAYHLVIPTHPGFGFSTPAVRGWDSTSIAGLYAKLMAELGYEKYVAQGGDFGAFVAPDMGRVDPEHVMGIHVNAASVGFMPFHQLSDEEVASLTDLEKQKLELLANYTSDINWYFDVQSKRPQTIAYALADSPIGLLAWIGEMFKDFSSQDNTLFDDERNRNVFYSNLTLYWLTNSFGSAANTYWEGMHNWGDMPQNSGVPTGVAVFARDPNIRKYSEELNTIIHWTDINEGGHFASLETPELLVKEINAFVAKLK